MDLDISNIEWRLSHRVLGKFQFVFFCLLCFLTNGTMLWAAENAEQDAKLDPLAWQTDSAIWTAVVFVLLIVVLRIFAFGPILKALDRREQDELDKKVATEKANADARELLEQYHNKISESETEVRQILATARVEADRRASEIVAEAKKVAVEERERALKDIAIASDSALREIVAKSAELATDLAGKILKQSVDETKHAELIEEAVKGMTEK